VAAAAEVRVAEVAVGVAAEGVAMATAGRVEVGEVVEVVEVGAAASAGETPGSLGGRGETVRVAGSMATTAAEPASAAVMTAAVVMVRVAVAVGW